MFETSGGGRGMKAAIYFEHLRTVHVGVHPLLRRLITGVSIAFDAESLEAALYVDQPDFVIVGTFSVPGFLEVERRHSDGVQIPCFVMGMTPAPLFEDDAVRFGFGGAVSIGGTVTEDEVAAEIQRCLTSDRRSPRSVGQPTSISPGGRSESCISIRSTSTSGIS